MDGYIQYQSLLNNSLQDAQAKTQEAQAKYESKLGAVEQIRATIERATEGVGDIFLVSPAEQIAKGVSKKLGDTVSDYSRKYFSQVSRDAGSGEIETSTEQSAQEALGQGGSIGEEMGQELSSYGEQEAETSFGRTTLTREGQGEVRGQTDETSFGGEGEAGQEATASNVTAESSSAVTDAGEATGEAVAEGGAELGVEAGAEAALLADPLTAIFGLILGIGTIVGGIEGGNSAVKNPSVPKPSPIANVSTQFGIGAN